MGMDQSERLPVLAFIAACLGLFFVLYLILGGEDSAVGVKIESHDEFIVYDELLDEDDTPVYRQRRPVTSTVRTNNSFSSSVETPQLDVVETNKRQIKEWPDWIKRHSRKNKTQSIEQKKAKLRAQLKAKGFKNQTYLDLRALDLERKGFKSARKKAGILVESGNIDEALQTLQEELDRTPEDNLLVRSEIVALQMGIAMKYGYASLAEDYFHQQMRLTRKINEIKKNTKLINNPNARAMMENTDKTLDTYEKSKESFPLLFQSLKENNGFLPGMKDTMKRAMVGSIYGNSNSNISADQMRSIFKGWEKQVEKGWANPK
tara:strand:- start:1338 stop:2294 length:957 start_codon:yes stop_codon:yes gene_type:complete